MPNIEIHGLPRDKANKLKIIIDKLMKDMQFEGAVTGKYNDLVETCDENHETSPYVRIWSTDLRDIISIMDAFQNDEKMHIDVEAPSVAAANGLFFFDKDQINSGKWKKLIDKRIAIFRNKDLEFMIYNK